MKFDYNKEDNAVILYPENEYDCFCLGKIFSRVKGYLVCDKDDPGQQYPNKIERIEIPVRALVDAELHPL